MKKSSTYLQLKRPANKSQYKTSSIVGRTQTRIQTEKSLSQSYLTINDKNQTNGIKLPSAYYNDRQQIYLAKSRALSEKSLTYQSRQISFSQRRKLKENQIEKVVQKRSKSYTMISASNTKQTISLPNKNNVRDRLTKLNDKKYSLLMNGGKDIRLEKRMLNKVVSEKRERSTQNRKWSSPFRDTQTFKNNFQGKNIIAKKFQGFPTNKNPSELKVLNLDRLFKNKDGKLQNIIPLPTIKLDSVLSRTNVINNIKKKDTIHHVIQEFNKLLHINKIKKTKPRIGVKGHNFLRNPTLEELMGIKIYNIKQESAKKIKAPNLQQSQQQIPQEIFIEYNEFYKQHMKKNIHLTRRLLSGIKKIGNFNLGALVRFYAIFINRIASFSEKIKFLLYFFIPHGQEKIQLDVMKLILELMCEQLPPIDNLSSEKQQFLSKKDKSIIFLQALNKVLFSDLKQFVLEDRQQSEINEHLLIDRNILVVLLERNQDAVDLLIKLLLMS